MCCCSAVRVSYILFLVQALTNIVNLPQACFAVNALCCVSKGQWALRRQGNVVSRAVVRDATHHVTLRVHVRTQPHPLSTFDRCD